MTKVGYSPKQLNQPHPRRIASVCSSEQACFSQRPEGVFILEGKMKEYIIKAKVIKKLEIAIDKIIDVKDEGYGCDSTERCLEMLNSMIIRLSN